MVREKNAIYYSACHINICTPQMYMYYKRKRGTGISVAFEHFFVPSLGIFTTHSSPNCGFVDHSKRYLIRFEQFSSAEGVEFHRKSAKKI